MIATILGGIGLFLLGMVLLTDGLKAAAGDALRRGLARLTGGPVKALVSGIGTTALVQSSSATVLATIGFVSAGLLTFPQAIGVILGANLGTTSTGWIVALLGLKLNVGTMALPLVGLGAFARLLARGRPAALGSALAGFGLIFFGIDVLQGGMATLSTRFDPSAFPGGTALGRLALVGIGIAMTVVMQSSSAAVATTLTALHTDTIDLAQGAALVIGQNVGTTVTAALAAIGASAPARRTALVHILFNFIAAVFAFLLLPVFLAVTDRIDATDGVREPATALAAFHTAFNVLGVMLVLPFTRRLAALVTRLVPERGLAATRHLDPSVAQVPAVAVEAARRAVMEVAARVFAVMVAEPGTEERDVLDDADLALADVRRFFARVRTSADAQAVHERHQDVLHAIDHLDRLIEALREPPPERAFGDPVVAGLRSAAVADVDAVRAWLLAGEGQDTLDALERRSAATAEARRVHRTESLASAARGEVDPDETLDRVEAMRWIDRLLYHAWRVTTHLAGTAQATSVSHEPAGRAT